MRLTEVMKLFDDRLYQMPNNKSDYSNAVVKLGQLEDIEEELGIDLITLFKALKNGIYYTNYGHGIINYCDKVRLIPCYIFIHSPKEQTKREIGGYDFIVSKKGLTINTKSYKKYWALTKEELE